MWSAPWMRIISQSGKSNNVHPTQPFLRSRGLLVLRLHRLWYHAEEYERRNDPLRRILFRIVRSGNHRRRMGNGVDQALRGKVKAVSGFKTKDKSKGLPRITRMERIYTDQAEKPILKLETKN